MIPPVLPSNELASPSLLLIGTVHGDPRGYERALKLLRAFSAGPGHGGNEPLLPALPAAPGGELAASAGSKPWRPCPGLRPAIWPSGG